LPAKNTAADPRVNSQTEVTESFPAGKCRPAVRGFSASIQRSTKRLNAIAALRAPTMQITIPHRKDGMAEANHLQNVF